MRRLLRQLPGLVVLFGPLTTAGVHRVLPDFYVYVPSSVSIATCLDRSSLLQTPNSQGQPLPVLFVVTAVSSACPQIRHCAIYEDPSGS